MNREFGIMLPNSACGQNGREWPVRNIPVFKGLEHIRLGMTALAIVLALGSRAEAGPPFVTDDPEPTDTGHWEIYNYIQGMRALGATSGQGGMDIDYGAYKDVQLTVVVPVNYQQVSSLRVGAADIEPGVKYRFLHQSEDSFLPDVSFFPNLEVPVADRFFGTGRLGVFLPLWAEKDFDKWQLFGGGGYMINPGPEQRDFWRSGIALQRTITDRLSLGVEVYHTTPDTFDALPYTGLNLGVTYKLSENWSFLASGGPGIQNAREGGRYDFYAALKLDY
jgi:hypothetical protein